jgi:hypothetical protein
MKKKLDETGIANELKGASLFFQRPADVQEEETVPEIQTQAKPRRRTAIPKKADAPVVISEGEAAAPVEAIEQTASELAEKPKAADATPSPTPSQEELVETIRKNVKQLGKESAFCRFTEEEKSALGDIVYKYKRNGIRTSENEVVRIAVNWLLETYRSDEQRSLLAQVLTKLNA